MFKTELNLYFPQDGPEMRKDLLALVIIAPISCFCAMILQFVLKYKYDQTLIPLRKLIELRAEKRKELIAAK